MPTNQDLNTNTHCLNCGSPVSGNYCSHCGQATSTGRITFGETFSSFLSAAFSFEGPFMGTVKWLILNPGKVFREYIGGKRKTYYKPVPFYILTTALYLIVRAIVKYDPLEGQMAQLESPRGPSNSAEISAAADFMVKNINNIMFFLVFSIALMLKLFFRKRYNLAEYASVGFYIAGLYTSIGIFVMLISKYLVAAANNYQLFILFVIILYSSSSLIKSYKFGLVLKYILVGLFSIVLYVALGFGFSVLMTL